MTSHVLHRILTDAGFVAREGAKHTRFTHPDGRITVVHRHRGDIPFGTLKAISRETGIPLP